MASEIAESIIERYLGYSITPKEHEEHLKLGKYGFELTYKPFLSLVSVIARTDEWGAPGMSLGQSVWIDIPIHQVHVFTYDSITLLNAPPTLFGTAYTEVKVTYKAGLTDVPDALEEAIKTVTNLIHKGEIDSWNCQLPTDVLEVLDSYRKEDK